MAQSNFPGRPARLEDVGYLLKQEPENNRSLMRHEAWIKKNSAMTASHTDPDSSFEFFVNGAKIAEGDFGFNFNNYDELLLARVDVWIPHNADGTKQNIPVDLYCNAQQLGYTEVRTSFSLPTIARATVGAFSGGDAFDAGTAKTINLPRASSLFTHDVTFQFGAATGTIATGAGVTAAWTPPLSLLTQIPNAEEGVGRITVTTKQAGAVVGTPQDTTFTLRAGTGVVPTIPTVAVADDNPTVATNIGALVQGQSRAKVTVTGAGAQGSTIAAAQFSLEGATAASGQVLPVPVAGTRVVASAVTDSRGRTTSRSNNIAVLAYTEPSILSWKVERTTGGVADPQGASLTLTMNAAVQSLVNGTQKNALTLRVFSRPRGGAWTARNVITGGLIYNTSVLISGGAVFATNQAWEIRVEVADKLLTTQDYTTVPTAKAILHSKGGKVAVGKQVEDAGPATQLEGPARTYGDHAVDGLVTQGGFPLAPVGTIHMWLAGTIPGDCLEMNGQAVSRATYAALFALWGTTFGAGNGTTTFNVDDWRGRSPFGFDATQTEFNTVGKKAGAKTVTLTAAQSGVPAHSHGVAGGTHYLANGSGGTPANLTTGGGGYQLAAPQNNTAQNAAEAHPNLPPSVAARFIVKAR